MRTNLSLAPVFPSVRQASPLVLTDFGFLLALALALLIAIDPFEMLLERLVYTKHLALMMLLPALLLALIGRSLAVVRYHQNLSVRRHSSVLRAATLACAPLVALAVFIIGGGMVSRFVDDIRNSFLVAGVYLLVAPMAAAMVLLCRDPAHLLQGYRRLLLASSMIVFVGLAVNYGVHQVYHELEFLFPPLAIYYALAARSMVGRWIGVAFFLLLAFLFKKNTGYLSALVVLGYLGVIVLWHRWARMDGIKRAAALHWSLVAIVLLGGVISFLYLNRSTYLPSGNPGFRLLTYERAWNRFLDSPVWGTLFAAPGTEEFTAFNTGVSDNILPTHSDVLDLLAHGGVIAIALWLWGLLRVAHLAMATVLSPRHRLHALAPMAHTLAAMSIVGVVTYAFNPLFLQPARAFLLWADLGLLAGAALAVQRQARNDFSVSVSSP